MCSVLACCLKRVHIAVRAHVLHLSALNTQTYAVVGAVLPGCHNNAASQSQIRTALPPFFGAKSGFEMEICLGPNTQNTSRIQNEVYATFYLHCICIAFAGRDRNGA